MKRRSFLSLLGMAAVAAPLIRLLPNTPPVAQAQVMTTWGGLADVPTAAAAGMQGVPYFVNNTGDYFGLTRIPRDFYKPMVSKEEIAERERWYNSLPRNRSLIPEDYRRG